MNVKFKDSDLNNVVSGGEWFTHFDILHQEMMHSQNYSIMGHLHFPILAAHFLFSSASKSKLSFPMQNTEFRNRLTQCNNVLGKSNLKVLTHNKFQFCITSGQFFEIVNQCLVLVNNFTLRKMRICYK